uniref:Plastid lipid-associated protein/fibrillin conserved domain-containing protein n=1 Tax=Tetraselmis chuii TaxID=63592 RepID=A0A7S1T497_9CHLO|mmetsp:Transcript_43838/g.78343  ORF Transcript_43838/g.78343 Transcript_43838/m.78343 type:complete len:268 (+) Transcript_43838:133-936(+)|eukprot:CAMPEP_0177761494 /NCGR_PEP_ID=MMETSP0491_2-20121128/5836_1 /TAXON_ID=63592 /ORGANISM="Tetraselmis chuii, Strain PLY429" /LENGTH=267 /DNA_ID=CAMNT_0019277475 /DNA_START=99 /DNA_END=902 /DNA_ORIENTATION=-
MLRVSAATRSTGCGDGGRVGRPSRNQLAHSALPAQQRVQSHRNEMLRRKGRHGPLRIAAATSSQLLEVIESSPEDKGAVLGVASELDSAPETALTCLDGDWTVSWTDLGKGWISKAVMGLFTPSLKMLSFGTLPPVKVAIVDSYNRVRGGSYDLLQVFQLEGSDVTAAMVLSGTCGPDLERPNRLNVQFSSVRVLTREDAPLEWRDVLVEAGLGDALTAAQGVVAKCTYIDVDYIDDVLRVHKGESGTTYVLRRLQPPAHIPFPLEP